VLPISVLSIQSVAQGLGASFLYKRSALHDGSLRHHGLLVYYADAVVFTSYYVVNIAL